MRIRFDRATCRTCPTRQVCTAAKDAPQQRTVRPQAHHEAIQAARQRQETAEFKTPYALRGGVESRLSQGIRRFALRQSRSIGLARTHLQHRLTAAAMHGVRGIAWLWGEPFGERRRRPGHFAQLAPHPFSRQTVLCEEKTEPTESTLTRFGGDVVASGVRARGRSTASGFLMPPGRYAPPSLLRDAVPTGPRSAA